MMQLKRPQGHLSQRGSHRQLGRPRVLTKFQEFTLVMMRLRLGLLERDIAHRFKVSPMTVSRITRSWIRFLRYEFT